MQNNAEKDDINNINDYVFKLVLVGDSGVGKSCIMHHFMYNRFKKDTTQTIGVDFSAKNINVNNQDIKLQIWDTAGQEKFRSVARSYYRGAIGIIIVYDITKPGSFEHVMNWLTDAKNSARSECSVCVVGNKSDLSDKRVIQYNDGDQFCQENNLLFFECSALTGDNIDDIFNEISKHILNKIENGLIEPNSVISSYAKEMRKVNALTNEKIDNENSRCGGMCTMF